ncbi:MAG: 50S ribosomal protein L29 [bacterium]
MLKMDALKQLPKEEIEIRLEDTIDELENLKYQMVTHQLDNPLKIRYIRRDIARLKTILREYELGIREKKEKKA